MSECGGSLQDPVLKFSLQDDIAMLAQDSSGNEFSQLIRQKKGRSRITVVVGHAQSGKSTLLKQTCHQLVEREDKMVLLWWDVLQHSLSTVQSVDKLAALPQMSRTAGKLLDRNGVLKELQRNGGKNILLIIDHLTQSSKFLHQLLSKSALPLCSIVLTLQYSHVELVLGNVSSHYELFEIQGVAIDDVYELVSRKGRELEVKGIDRMADYVRANPELLDLCRHPVLAKDVLKIYQNNKSQCPKTVTALIKAIVDNKIETSSVDDNEADEHLNCVCRLAYETHRHDSFSCHEFSCLCATIGIPGPTTQIGLGLLQIFNQNGRIYCKYRHKTIQTFLAVMYVRSKPVYDQAYITMDLTSGDKLMTDEKSKIMLVYYCGTADTHSASSLNVAKIVLYPILESIADRLSLDETQDPEKIIFFLKCLHEAQDPTVTRKFLSRRQHLLSIPLDNNLAESKLEMLSYCVAHSGISKWKVETPDENIYLMEYFKMLTADKSSMETKANFDLVVEKGDTNLLSPLHPKMIHSKKATTNIYSKITRELFHRLLQLHSPIKLKSDGSNAAYISLLACECLQNAMAAKDILTLEPITANHWLPVKQKSGKKTANQQEENQQTLHHMRAHHDRQHVEFVVMMTPLPQRIKFAMPGTKEEIIIELSSNQSPDFFTSKGIEEHIDLMLAGRFLQETQDSSSSQIIVLPNLPLPKQSQFKALVLAPEPTCRHEPQLYSNQLATPVPKAETHTMSVASIERQQGQNIEQSHQHYPSGLNGSSFNYTFERSVQQLQSHRQPVLKPGTIIHSTIPHIFAMDQSYPLPNESCLIRKGGNGEIYLGVFGDRELIIKKTSYRNREFMIHSKLSHQNVVQLLCLMIDRIPSQGRKWFCFHFLPKATGDLARLALDKQENTLVQLKAKYAENPRKLGLVQDNMKYLLRQILQGLIYLHGLNIVHRDLKASNILLTFHCTCPSPVICTCATKFDVHLADFDSAIQLSEDGLLPASHTSKRDQKKTFTIIPVGTTGYRPPESSQLIISNDVSSITPGVTTKSDIWSFGVLMMRMLNGTYGPTTQRESSTLLLYYNNQQQKTVNTKRKWSMDVKQAEVFKILKLSKLQEEIHWNSEAVDCVRMCLQIDPEKRKSAQDLLGHGYLY